MRALRGGIPRAFKSHRTPAGAAYGRYCRAKVERLGRLSADAARWLKEAGLLTLSLDQLHEEAETTRAALTNGAGRRARDKARATLKSLERRAARLRASLEASERRLEELARHDGQGEDLAAQLARLHRERERSRA